MQDSLSVYIPNSFLETKHTKIGNKAHLGGMEGVRKDPRRLKAGDSLSISDGRRRKREGKESREGRKEGEKGSEAREGIVSLGPNRGSAQFFVRYAS